MRVALITFTLLAVQHLPAQTFVVPFHGLPVEVEAPPEVEENRAFLGIVGENLSVEKADRLGFENHYGTYVTYVIPGTGAARAGIQPFDYVFGIDEYRTGASQSLGFILSKYAPGDEVEVHLVRRQAIRRLQAVLGSREKVTTVKRDACQDPFLGVAQPPESGRGEGLAVGVLPNSSAAEMGMRSGDRILRINGFPIIDWKDVGTAVDMLTPGDPIRVEVLRGGRTLTLKGTIKSYSATKGCAECTCGGSRFSYYYSALGEKPQSGVGVEWERVRRPRPQVEFEARLAPVEASELHALKGALLSRQPLEVQQLHLSSEENKGLFELRFRLPSRGNTLVRIYNAAGRMVYEYELAAFSGVFRDEVDLTSNGAGTYFLLITQNGRTHTRKIIVSRR
ncbi:MAG: PDZ domain-containing protein [Bacteroidetes bacterium]|nr:MAG: PDZ domain-containing protein [Bacteroidota bacterium]